LGVGASVGTQPQFISTGANDQPPHQNHLHTTAQQNQAHDGQIGGLTFADGRSKQLHHPLRSNRMVPQFFGEIVFVSLKKISYMLYF
jgi:deoxycytidylate deaminase